MHGNKQVSRATQRRVMVSSYIQRLAFSSVARQRAGSDEQRRILGAPRGTVGGWRRWSPTRDRPATHIDSASHAPSSRQKAGGAFVVPLSTDKLERVDGEQRAPVTAPRHDRLGCGRSGSDLGELSKPKRYRPLIRHREQSSTAGETRHIAGSSVCNQCHLIICDSPLVGSRYYRSAFTDNETRQQGGEALSWAASLSLPVH